MLLKSLLVSLPLIALISSSLVEAGYDQSHDEVPSRLLVETATCSVFADSCTQNSDCCSNRCTKSQGDVQKFCVPSTAGPTAVPTNLPTLVPTVAPTTAPTAGPTTEPTAVPTSSRTLMPSATPTTVPTTGPTAGPTAVPSSSPTLVPTAAPTTVPTAGPTAGPTAVPTSLPTLMPTAAPTPSPTVRPTAVPTSLPTLVPTTAAPTQAPTSGPSPGPTISPTLAPTAAPTQVPTSLPTLAMPSKEPTTALPTAGFPTSKPTLPYEDQNNNENIIDDQDEFIVDFSYSYSYSYSYDQDDENMSSRTVQPEATSVDIAEDNGSLTGIGQDIAESQNDDHAQLPLIAAFTVLLVCLLFFAFWFGRCMGRRETGASKSSNDEAKPKQKPEKPERRSSHVPAARRTSIQSVYSEDDNNSTRSFYDVL